VQKKHLIVVFETDDLVRGLLHEWLRDAGYVVIAGTLSDFLGSEGPAMQPQLIVIDVPDPAHGDSIVETLKRVYAGPILALSGRFRRGLGASAGVAERFGVQRVLSKPFTREELLDAVSHAIEFTNG
jgi:CheY-like chemotaxis protein